MRLSRLAQWIAVFAAVFCDDRMPVLPESTFNCRVNRGPKMDRPSIGTYALRRFNCDELLRCALG